MNILQVIPVFNPPELFGGSQQTVYQISKELAKRGHNVSIYTSDAKRSNLEERVRKATERTDGINIFYFRNVCTQLTKKIGLVVTPQMKKSLEQEAKNFDLIHVHEARGYQHVVVWKIARKNKLPYIVQAHGVLGERGGLSRKIYDFVFGGKALRDATMNIALNEHEVEQYAAVGVPRNRITIIPNGIDLSEYADLPPKGSFKKKLGIDYDEKIVLYLGRIHKIKGIDILVKAFANIVQKIDGVKLAIIGPDDGFLRELQALIKALKIKDNVLILGPLCGKDKLKAYVDADVYVLPSKYEIWGITVLEAIACGTPVILTENCEIAKYFRDNVGCVVKPNSNHLGEALLSILSVEADETGLRAMEFVKQFDIKKTVDMLEGLYHSVTSFK